MNLRNVSSAIATCIFLGLAYPANAQGLSKVRNTMQDFEYELTTVIPIVATILLVLSAVGYMAKLIDKADFVRWVVGIIIAGSAAQVVAIFY